MRKLVAAVLWPTEANYAQLVAISVDPLPTTLDKYRERVARKVVASGLADAEIVRITFEPAELARWCADRGRAVDAQAREAFAAWAGAAHHERSEQNRTSRR